MAPRINQGNSLTVGSAEEVYMKKIVGGKPVLIGTLPLDEAVQAQNSYYKAP
jgi:hypothetical protein